MRHEHRCHCPMHKDYDDLVDIFRIAIHFQVVSLFFANDRVAKPNTQAVSHICRLDLVCCISHVHCAKSVIKITRTQRKRKRFRVRESEGKEEKKRVEAHLVYLAVQRCLCIKVSAAPIMLTIAEFELW